MSLSNYLHHYSNVEVGLCSETQYGVRRSTFLQSNIQLFDAPKLRNKKNIVNNINSVKKAIQNFSPDVVHTHSLYVLIISFIIRKLFNLKYKIVHTGHGGPAENYDDMASKLLWMADRYVVISCHSYEYLNNNSKRHNLKLIKNGTKKPRDNEVIRINNGNDFTDIRIAFIGRLTDQKGLPVLFDAIDILQKKGLKLKVLIIGSGDKEDALKSIAKEKNLESIITFKGFIDEPWMEVVDYPIIVMPSLWEPGGLVAIEGIIRNHTVVASNIQGLKESIIDGENGYLFEKGNANELANKISDIYFKDKYINLPKIEREKYLFENSTGPKYLETYHELLKEI